VRVNEGRPPAAVGRHQWLVAITGFAAGKAIPGVLTLVSIPLWLSSFGATNYALFSLYWTCSLIGTALGVGWLNQAILRHAGNEDMAYERLPWRTRWALEAAPLMTVVPLSVLTRSILGDDESGGSFLLAAALGLLVNGRYVVRQTVVQRDAQARTYAVAETARTASALAFSYVLASAGMVASWSLVAANAAGTCIALAILGRRKTAQVQASGALLGSGAVVRQFWTFGWPMSLWLALSASTMYMDRFLVSSFYGLGVAGHYAAAADLAVRGMGILVAPAIMFLHPTFMRSWNTGERREALRIWRRMTLFLALGTSATAVAMLVAYLLFAGMLLESPPSTPVFAALVVGGAIWQLALMIHKPVEASNRTLALLGALLVSLLTTLVADILLSRALDVLGIAMGLAVGGTTYIGLVALLTVRTLRPRPRLEASA
jgi:O-antigen/teichoic acid export membrane protein